MDPAALDPAVNQIGNPTMELFSSATNILRTSTASVISATAWPLQPRVRERLRSTSAVLALVLLMFAGLFALELTVADPRIGIAFLFALPIVVLAVRFGPGGSVAGIALALVLVGVSALVMGAKLEPLGFVARGGVFLVVGMLAAQSERRPLAPRVGTNGGANGLTPRETEVLQLLALGYTNNEIAGDLCLSPRTVESHRARVQQKLRCSRRADLVRYAYESGLIANGEDRATGLGISR